MDVNYVDECEQNIYENDANESTSQVSDNNCFVDLSIRHVY
jgi:hypothetical protein